MEQRLKMCLTTILNITGINSIYLKMTSKNFIRILNYHSIDYYDPNFMCDYITLYPMEFEKQINILIKKGFKFISFDELQKIANGEEKLKSKEVLLTFDDGFKSVFDNAFPVLNKLKIPFVIFLTSGPIENNEKNFWWEKIDCCISNFQGIFELEICSDLFYKEVKNKRDKIKLYRKLINRLVGVDNRIREEEIAKIEKYTHVNTSNMKRTILNKEEVKELYHSGICSIEGHTVTHKALNNCSNYEITWEIQNNMIDIEKITGSRPVSFSFPNGLSSNNASKIAWDLGCKFIFTSSDGLNRITQNNGTDILVFDRASIGSNDSKHAFWSKVSGTYICLKKVIKLAKLGQKIKLKST